MAKLVCFRAGHIPVLKGAMGILGPLLGGYPGAVLSARIKNMGTVCEKIVRFGTRLTTIQDIAGIRIVLPQSSGRAEQDRLCDDIRSSGCLSGVKVVDRRAEPSAGYRAGHLVGQSEGLWVELQVRTFAQHAWAQMYERLADILGRQIRYGEPPRDGVSLQQVTGKEINAAAGFCAISIAEAEEAESLPLMEQALTELGQLREVLERENRPPAAPRAGMLEGAGNWYLVAYDRVTVESLIEDGQKNDDKSIFDAWREIEERYAKDDNVEVVLLWAASHETLQQTHARYFTSTPGVE